MSNVNTNAMTQAKQFGNSPFGNLSALPFRFETNASGIALNTDLATAVQVADVVRIGILPAGMTLMDSNIVVSDAFTAATTASIGFLYKDGVDSTAVPQDAAYFVSALDTATAACTRKTGVKAPVVLPKDAYLTLTIGGAAHAAVGVLDVIVQGIHTGEVAGSLASQQNP